MMAADGAGQSFPECGFGSDVAPEMRHSEGDMPSFVLSGHWQTAAVTGIRSTSLD